MTKLTYVVERWSSMFGQKALAYKEFHRSDAARNALWAEIYEMLYGLRDRPVALRLMAEFDECETSAPKHGYMREAYFYLSSADRQRGEYVRFTAWRV